MKLRLLDLVEYELDRLVPKLESARSGTGLRLYKEFAEAGRTIRKNPYFFPTVEDPPDTGGEYREASLLRMTYRMIYEIRQSEIVVVSMIHSNRKPGSWHRALNDE